MVECAFRMLRYPSVPNAFVPLQVGMAGILRPLLFQGFPSETYGYPPIRWTIEYKWQAYAGKHSIYFLLRYVGLATLFSIYACIVAYEIRQELENMLLRDWYATSQGRLALGCLVGATVLALNDLHQECRQVYRYWKDGKRQVRSNPSPKVG